MSTINTILNKLGKIEEIEKTNLEKHEVELALVDEAQAEIDDIINTHKNILQRINEFEKSFNQFNEIVKQKSVTLTRSYEVAKNKFKIIDDKFAELGLNPPANLEQNLIKAKELVNEIKPSKLNKLFNV